MWPASASRRSGDRVPRFFLSANDGAVRSQYLDWDAIEEFLPSLWKGLWLNIKVFVVAELLVLVWGLVLALARIFPGKAGRPVRFLPWPTSTCSGASPPSSRSISSCSASRRVTCRPSTGSKGTPKLFWLSTTSLVLVYGAYVAEVYRAGLESIHWSQTAAARSLGLSYGQTMRYVITPRPCAASSAAAQRLHRPAEGHRAAERRGPARSAQPGPLTSNRLFNLSPNLAAGVAFVVITIPLARFTDWLVARQARARAGG